MKCLGHLVLVAAALAAGCQDASAPAASASSSAPAAPQQAQQAPPTPTTPPPAVAAAKAPVTEAYAADIQRLCNAVALSGAADEVTTDRMFIVAQWLGPNLRTRESREFLVHIQPLAGEPKAQALVAEARRVGLADCALAAEWRQPPPSPIPAP
ncbi:MAG: hypothetical protein KIT31_24885 [Deltaproteobacteria bacterium]|nr:hypothetical protein [Deltaproteobacteria bacterium]